MNKVLAPERLPPREEGIKVCVTGGRDFANYEFVAAILDTLEISVLAHGAARGADLLAARWCRRTRTPVRPYPAEWGAYGDRAGPKRNRKMLDDFQPQLVVAFTGGVGTTDCIRCARERKIPVWKTWAQLVSPEPMSSISA